MILRVTTSGIIGAVPDTWTHELPMRWADLDMLNHVTNVVYVDYALEAQAVLRRDGHLETGRPVRDVTVTYRRPTPLSSRPLLLRSSLSGDVLDQEVCTTSDDAAPAVHARIVTTHGEPAATQIPAFDDDPLTSRVRAGDVDATGAVSVSGLVRLVQEARIRHFSSRMERSRLGQFVLGTISLQPIAAVTWRTEPYEARSWITRVGRGSFTIDTALFDTALFDAGQFTEQEPLFTSQTVLVGFDAAQQISRPFTDDEREHLEAHLR